MVTKRDKNIFQKDLTESKRSWATSQ